MTTEQDRIIEDLLLITQKQSDNIEIIAQTVTQLTAQVASKPSKKNAYGLSIALSVITVLAVLGMFLQLRDNSNFIKDCVSIDGDCRQQRLADTTESDLRVLCNDEKQTVYFIISGEGTQYYKTIDQCIPFIENELQIEIADDGVILAGE